MQHSIKMSSKKYKNINNNSLFDCRGFSLIELFIVICIVAVLATIGTPWLLSMKVKSSIRADARDVHSTFRQAQAEAVKRGDIACVDIQGTRRYQIQIADYFDSGADEWVIEPGESTMLETKLLRPGNEFVLDMDDYFATNPEACFNYRGLPASPVPGSLIITRSRDAVNDAAVDDARLAMQVHLSASGHVKSEARNWE